jgi:uroporphyrinogen III methyltransferase/synthase
VDPRLLRIPYRPGCRRIYVGKEVPGRASRERQQARINALMVRHARAGRLVVRLKGGDPYIFGRGGEEGRHLAAAGIPFEVVPGVTAALGAAATTGIPFTHRGVAGEVTFATAHEAEGAPPPPWEALGKLRGTIVFYMGTYTLEHAARRLIESGRPASTPAAVVERATTPRQRTVVGTLATIADDARRAGVRPPSLVVVGDAVALRPDLDWFERRPLFGRRVLLARPAEPGDWMEKRLEEAGAEVALLPALEFRAPASSRALDAALRSAGTRDWIVFTSRQGVSAAEERLRALGLDARAFGGARIAVVGDRTAVWADALLRLKADLVPARATAEGLAAALRKENIRGQRVLLLRADRGREALPRLLRKAGAAVDDVAAYRSVAASPDPERVRELAAGAFDAALITSGEIAANLRRFLGRRRWPARTKIVTIGPVTSGAVRELGWKVAKEAKEPKGIVEAAVQAVGARNGRR